MLNFELTLATNNKFITNLTYFNELYILKHLYKIFIIVKIVMHPLEKHPKL